jgi:hypothetical protein
MEKYIAFGLYRKNELGGHQEALDVTPGVAKDVYMASDVDALLQKLSHARLTWAMGCPCKCQACAELDDLLKELMVK